MITMATTQTIQSPDKAVVKTEYIDIKFLQQLAVNQDVEKETRAVLRNLLKSHIKRGNQIDVYYVLGKSIKHEHLGRWIAKGGIGLQTLPKNIRSALAGDLYWDVDMVNAQPKLLVQYCEKLGWDCTNLKKYTANRDQLLNDVMNYLNCDKPNAKERIVSLLFGGSANGLPEFFQNELYPELRKISQLMWDKNISVLKSLAKLPNHYSKGLAQILQTEERKCLESMDLAFAKHGRSLDTYIHDGGLVRKLDNEKELPETLLNDVEKFVLENTGYSIELIVKPMTSIYEKEASNQDEYTELKNTFETQYFKIMSPSIYCRAFEDSITSISLKDLIHQQQNLLLKDESSFVSKWLKDKDIRTYEKLEYAPKQIINPEYYNIFTKFKTDPKQGADISIIHELLFQLCGKDDTVKTYVEKWLASIIQKPYIKTRVCLIFKGVQGTGKDTYWNFIGDILGQQYFFSTSTPENSIFNQFNTGSEKAIIVKFEEANFQTNKANADKLKSIITKEKETYVKKGQDGIILNDYRNFVMTTNNDIPVLIEDSDRRFVLIKGSKEKRGIVEFWNEVYKSTKNIEVQEAYHHYLLNLDISDFDPTKRVITEYYKEVRMGLMPYHAKFLYQKIMIEKAARSDTFILRDFAINLWKECSNTCKFELTNTRFGIDIAMYCDAGAIIKTRSSRGITYEILPDNCLKFMAESGWIEDM